MMKIDKDKIKESFLNLRNYLFMLKFVMKSAPLLMICTVLFDAMTEIPWVLSNVVLLKYIIDVISSGTDVYRVFIACGLFAGLVILGNLGNTIFYEILMPVQKEKLNKKLYEQIYEKAARMDLSSYDDPKFYNDFVLAMNTMGERIEAIIHDSTTLFTNVIAISTITGIVASVDPMCLVFVTVCILMMLPVGRIIAKVNVKRTEAMTPLDRKNLYFWRVFYLQDYAKEIRLNPAGEMTERRYQQNIADRLFTITPFLKKQWKLYFCQESAPFTLLIYLGVTLYLGYKAIIVGDMDMGEFAASFNGAINIGDRMFFLTSWFAVNFRENGLYVEKFKKFMNADEKIKSGTHTEILSEPKTIKLENVSFTYPGNNKPTLKNINLEIKPYQKIALVGYNGAGKTTLTNLLLRLYDVTEGSITIGDRNIKEWDTKAYHDNFAAVFQDFSLFGATVGENVAMSDIHDDDKVFAALKESGFDKKLSKGADTVLLREFDDEGLSLSGGESQKVAIARTFYKNCPFAILDEPSANLDPMSEYALNEAMSRAADNKTVIFISHRLSTTVMADVIYMLENGEIIESGSHEELMAKNGKYAYMFNLQAEKYK